MTGRRTRNLIRALTGAALAVALIATASMPVPEVLPAVAIRQETLYRLEVALLVFYGWMLLITPAFSGLVRGHLPVEISTRGAKFVEEADHSTRLNEEKISGLNRLTIDLSERLEIAEVEIKRMKEAPESDNSQPKVGSRNDGARREGPGPAPR
jgi:hypothetical protein